MVKDLASFKGDEENLAGSQPHQQPIVFDVG
jgi:hypothetical protein